MRDLKKASAIIESVVNAVNVPVSLKARLGWDDGSKNAKDLGLLAEQCGVQLIQSMRELAINFIKALRIGMPFWKLKKRLRFQL